MNSHASKIWVRIYAILGMIGSIFLFIGGLSLLTGGNIVPLPTAPGVSNGMILLGIIFLLIFIGLFLTYLFFYKLKRWARIVVIILMSIGLLVGLVSLIIMFAVSTLVSFLISLWFFYVITFDKGTKELFKK